MPGFIEMVLKISPCVSMFSKKIKSKLESRGYKNLEKLGQSFKPKISW